MQERYATILEDAGLDPSTPFDGATDGEQWYASGDELEVTTPIDGDTIGTVRQATAEDYERTVQRAQDVFEEWASAPAPERGEVVRDLGEALRDNKAELGRLITLEMGKIVEEGEGEVQEAIDIADFAVGLSRQLYGKTMATERPDHRMYEQWKPLGPIGIITAFNFPCAVWSWNSCIAAVCGDTMIWKPSSATPLTAIAVSKLANEVFTDHGYPGVMNLTIGPGSTVGEKIANDRRLPLVSATGSTEMGYHVGETVASRMGSSILELGGNNGVIVTDSADLDLAERAITFGAVGTAGQRCTSIRRVFAHEDVADDLVERLVSTYEQVDIGDPLDEDTLMGPLIDEDPVDSMMEAITHLEKQGGEVLTGGERLPELGPNYCQPTIAEVEHDVPIVKEETFAPLLYVIRYEDLEEAIEWHNDVPQGLSSAIFTENVKEAERFLGPHGSDCGIANVNIGTSGAEIGGAFGGEKDTGGGREAGSDSWKQYMCRQTVTINYSDEMPLSQGIDFSVE
ncbi:aldehyde dehydrogenase family protein [Thermoplasmatales archaeon SW_10_69_26]|nr:MAG: aldehyde dehydrogenase family protein [Thermoplasmatales archaeon SW_10_69_26]